MFVCLCVCELQKEQKIEAYHLWKRNYGPKKMFFFFLGGGGLNNIDMKLHDIYHKICDYSFRLYDNWSITSLMLFADLHIQPLEYHLAIHNGAADD